MLRSKKCEFLIFIEFKIKCIIMLVVHQAALSDVMTMHFNVFQLIQLKSLDAAFIRNIA